MAGKINTIGHWLWRVRREHVWRVVVSPTLVTYIVGLFSIPYDPLNKVLLATFSYWIRDVFWSRPLASKALGYDRENTSSNPELAPFEEGRGKVMMCCLVHFRYGNEGAWQLRGAVTKGRGN